MLYASVAEAIEAARLLQMPLRISRFNCIGRENRGDGLEKVSPLSSETGETLRRLRDPEEWAGCRRTLSGPGV